MTLPSEWSVRELGQVVTLQRGFDLPAKHRRSGPYPVLTSGEGGGFHAEGPVAGPGVTIGRATNLGEPKWSEGDFWPHNTTLFVKDFHGNHPRWVFHLFESLDLSGYDSGSVQPMLNRNYVAKVPVRVPPVAVQEAIAEVLGALDDKTAANTRLLATAAELAVTLAHQGETLCTLADVASRVTVSIKPQEMKTAQVDHFSLPAYDDRRVPEAVSAESIKSNKFAVERPSVLLSKLNPRTPRIWDVVELSERPSLSSTEFMVLQSEEVSSSVLWAVLSQLSFMSEMKGMVAGTSGSHQRVRPDDVMTLQIADPRSLSSDTQGAITTLGRRIAQVRSENEQLTQTRDALLPLLMSGKATVRDAEQVIEEAL